MGRVVARPMLARQIAEKVDCTLRGDGNVTVQSVAPLESAVAGDLSFFSDSKHRRAAQCSTASVLIIVREGDANGCPAARWASRCCFCIPRRIWRLRRCLICSFRRPFSHAGIYRERLSMLRRRLPAPIADFAVIGARSKVGSGTTISSHCSVGNDVEIGADCYIHAGVRIGAGVKLGDRCVIQAGRLSVRTALVSALTARLAESSGRLALS